MGLLGDAIDLAGDVVEGAGDLAEEAFEAAAEAVEDVVEAIGDAGEDAVDALGELAEDALEALGDLAEGALETASDIYDAFAHLAEDALEGAVDLVEAGWTTIADAAEATWEAIADAAETAWEAIEEATEDAWDQVTEAVESLWDGAQRALEAAYEAASAAVEHAADAAASAYEAVLDTIERTLVWLGELIKDIAYAIAMLGACLAGIIVHNLAEADNVLMNFWKTPKRMSAALQTEAAPLFPGVPLDRVYYIENATLSANHFEDQADAMTFSQVEIAGVNFAYMIYVDNVIDDSILDDRALMIHELVHVDQYRNFRFEDAFACAYGVGFAASGFSYEENPIEAEAFAVQHAYENA